MSSFASYNRRGNSNVGFYPNDYRDQYSNNNVSDYGYNRSDYERGRNYRGQNYNNAYGNNYNTYDQDYYEDDHTRSYGPRRRNSYNNQYYPESTATYSNVIPSSRQYVDGGVQYTTRSSRRKPLIVSGNDTAYTARPAVKYLNPSSSTSSGYRAQGERGEPIPISKGLSYFDEGISLSTWIRRLFGVGPRRSRGHTGQSVHIKRWDVGRGWFSSQSGRSNTSVYTI